jgi:hypothetical protein
MTVIQLLAPHHGARSGGRSQPCAQSLFLCPSPPPRYGLLPSMIRPRPIHATTSHRPLHHLRIFMWSSPSRYQHADHTTGHSMATFRRTPASLNIHGVNVRLLLVLVPGFGYGACLTGGSVRAVMPGEPAGQGGLRRDLIAQYGSRTTLIAAAVSQTARLGRRCMIARWNNASGGQGVPRVGRLTLRVPRPASRCLRARRWRAAAGLGR